MLVPTLVSISAVAIQLEVLAMTIWIPKPEGPVKGRTIPIPIRLVAVNQPEHKALEEMMNKRKKDSKITSSVKAQKK